MKGTVTIESGDNTSTFTIEESKNGVEVSIDIDPPIASFNVYNNMLPALEEITDEEKFVVIFTRLLQRALLQEAEKQAGE